ncbi:hypothetical protein ABIA33_007104 [Streptacidiphilus sp. MAP12-16]|uniref:hypothetical protein n=1 Tax=Streptacidiphilus sp. MAP12-16 TaxID=3156300 RepID=UPI003516798E
MAYLPRCTGLTTTVLLLAALTSCTTHTTASSDAAKASPRTSSSTSVDQAPLAPLAYGPGPQSTYTVQAQPAAGSCHYGNDHGQPLPDTKCTPGALSPAVTQATVGTTICRSGGYTGTIRPPVGITNKEKAANAQSYGYTGALHDAEYDHLISLQLGGDPNDPRNLWVEPPSPGHQAGAGPNNPKDAVETRLHTAICKNQVTLTAAQQAIATDWETAEQRLGLKPDPSDTSGPAD